MSELVYKIKTKAPSNIALVKYWGKQDNQLPINPSLSMTLTHAHTITGLEIYSLESTVEEIAVSVVLDNIQNHAFAKRIETYITKLMSNYPELAHKKYVIKTHNSFPHSSGIASSASGFAALALGLWSFLSDSDIENLESASSLARRGSGSAARSFSGPYVSWGDKSLTQAHLEESHRELSLCDTIVLVEKGQKKISSSAGHKLMEEHHFKDARIQKAGERFNLAQKYIRENNWQALGIIIEQEALELHALMMTSSESFWLMSPETLRIMNWIREYRNSELKIPVFFTLDAGANVHCLYPRQYKTSFQEDFSIAFPKLEVIHDEQGSGACIVE